MAHICVIYFLISLFSVFFPLQKGIYDRMVFFPLYFSQNGKKWPQKKYADATMHRHFGTISK